MIQLRAQHGTRLDNINTTETTKEKRTGGPWELYTVRLYTNRPKRPPRKSNGWIDDHVTIVALCGEGTRDERKFDKQCGEAKQNPMVVMQCNSPRRGSHHKECNVISN